MRYYYSSVLPDINATAGLRALGAETRQSLVNAGLTRTADTGQIDWTTVTFVATINHVYGYEIWNILGGSLKMKISWVNVSQLSTGRVLRPIITVGTGSDGAGNLTGVLPLTMNQIASTNLAASNVVNYPSWICATDDFFGMVLKAGSCTSGGVFNRSWLTFIVEKIVDDSGTPDGTGWVFTFQNPTGAGSGNHHCMKAVCLVDGTTIYGSATIGSPYYTVPPFQTTDTSVGSDKQLMLHQVPTPRFRYTWGCFSVVASELAQNVTTEATPVGSTTREYVSLGPALGGSNVAATTDFNYAVCMLWEE